MILITPFEYSHCPSMSVISRLFLLSGGYASTIDPCSPRAGEEWRLVINLDFQHHKSEGSLVPKVEVLWRTKGDVQDDDER